MGSVRDVGGRGEARARFAFKSHMRKIKLFRRDLSAHYPRTLFLRPPAGVLPSTTRNDLPLTQFFRESLTTKELLQNSTL